jgi:hypothetical protein
MSTALQTTGQAAQLAQWSPPELPERLALLVSNSLPELLPEITADEAEQIEAALAVYEAHPKGSTPRQINKMMTKLALAYPNAKLSVEEAGARLELYEQMLADLDVDLLAAGFSAAVKTLKFFPSVAELRDLAMKQPATPRFQQRYRLRTLLEHYRNKPVAIEPPVTPEQRAAIKAELGLEREASALLDRVIGTEAPRSQAA